MSHLDTVDLVARRVVLSSLMRSFPNKDKKPAWMMANIEQTRQGILSVAQRVTDFEKAEAFIDKNRLMCLDRDLERKYIIRVAENLSSLVSGPAINLNALKTTQEIVEEAFARRPLPLPRPRREPGLYLTGHGAHEII